MLRSLAAKMWLWIVGPFQNRRIVAFWLVSSLSLGCTSAWLTIRDAQKVAAAEEDALLTPPVIAPSCDVISIHDGDTMKLDCGWDETKPQIITVRLYCIDAPELDQEPWGKLARDHLRSISGQAVAIEQKDRDKYGRLVALVHSDGRDLGLQMVADGFAPLYPKYCRDQRYLDAESKARSFGISIWSKPGVQQRPWEWRHGVGPQVLKW